MAQLPIDYKSFAYWHYKYYGNVLYHSEMDMLVVVFLYDNDKLSWHEGSLIMLPEIQSQVEKEKADDWHNKGAICQWKRDMLSAVLPESMAKTGDDLLHIRQHNEEIAELIRLRSNPPQFPFQEWCQRPAKDLIREVSESCPALRFPSYIREDWLTPLIRVLRWAKDTTQYHSHRLHDIQLSKQRVMVACKHYGI